MAKFEDEEPLMGCSEDNLPVRKGSYFSNLCLRWEKAPAKTKLLLHVFIILIYTFVCLLVLLAIPKALMESPNSPRSTIPSTLVEYKPRILPNFLHSSFSGTNHYEIDLQWHDLLDNISLRVTDEELAKNHNHKESVRLPEGGGQLVWLEASHHLHCVKMLRQWSYRDTYFPIDHKSMAYLKMERHIDHCLEMLRQVVMCRPDTSLTTFLWVNTQDKPILNIDPLEHDCVDWDVMVESLQDRVVSLEEINALKNPLHTEKGELLENIPLKTSE